MNFSQAPLLIKLDILHNYFSPSIIFLNIIKTFLTEGKRGKTALKSIFHAMLIYLIAMTSAYSLRSANRPPL